MSTPLSLFLAPRTAWWSLAIIALATCGGLAGAYAVTSQLSPTYQAHSSVVVTYADEARAADSTGPRTGNGEGGQSPAFDLSLLQALVPTVAHIAESKNVTMAAARSARVPSDQVVGQAGADYEPGDTIITLTASASTAAGASAMANAVADIVHDQVSDGRMVLGRRGVLLAQPLDRASPPDVPTTPKPALNLALGGTIGLLAVVALGTQSNTRLRTSSQIEAELGLAVLGTIPRTRHTRRRARKALGRRRVAAAVHATVAALSPGRSGRRLLVTSPTESDTKTLVAALLGLGFAEQEFQTTLIDTEFGRPRLAKHFSESAGENLQRLLTTNGQPPETHRGALRVVSADTIPPSAGRRLLSSRPFRAFADLAAARSEIVVLNGPPVLAGADLSALVGHADSAILVVTSGSTRTSEAQLAAQILSQLDIPVAGVVVAHACDTGGTGGYACSWDPQPERVRAEPSAAGPYAPPDLRPEPLAELPGCASTASTTTKRQRQVTGSSTQW